MRNRQCDREADVLESAGRGRCDDELRRHLHSCPECHDLFEVAAAVVEDRSVLMREARLPGSGLAWWRVSMRARQEAARTALRTAKFIQAALVVLAIIIALALLGTKVTTADVRFILTSAVAALGQFALPLVALGAWLILAPVAVYFAVTED